MSTKSVRSQSEKVGQRSRVNSTASEKSSSSTKLAPTQSSGDKGQQRSRTNSAVSNSGQRSRVDSSVSNSGQRSRVGSSASQRSRVGSATSDISDDDSIASSRSNRSVRSKASLASKGKQEWGKLKNAVRGSSRRKRGSKKDEDDVDDIPEPAQEDPDLLAKKMKQQVFEEDLPYIHRLLASDVGKSEFSSK